MSLRVGILTSGGDCQGLNPAMRAVGRTLLQADPETQIIGFLNGYAGLMQSDYRYLNDVDFSGILNLGGTILGASRQPFKQLLDPFDRTNPEKKDFTRLDAMLRTFQDLNLDALVVLGGNGSQKTANALFEAGVPTVSLPKTIDNDLAATELSFGFHSAVEIATQVIDGVHSTASSHGRVFIIQLMGHKTGWLTLYAGLSGGADVILIPEIPYNIKNILKVLAEREAKHRRFSIFAVAEGAVSQEEVAMSKEERLQHYSNTSPSVGYRLAQELEALSEKEFRVVVPGHFQRGGAPCAFDRVLTTEMGYEAAQMILEKDFGKMVAVENGRISRVKISKVADSLRTVPPDHYLVQAARAIGVSFGD